MRQTMFPVQDYVKTGSDRSAGGFTRAAAVIITTILLPWALSLRCARTAGRAGASLAALLAGVGRAVWGTVTPIGRVVVIRVLAVIGRLSAPARGVGRLLYWCSWPLLVSRRGAWFSMLRVASLLRVVGRTLRPLLATVLRSLGRVLRLGLIPVRLVARAASGGLRVVAGWAARLAWLIGRAALFIGRRLATVLATVRHLAAKLLKPVLEVVAIVVAAAAPLLTATGHGLGRLLSFGHNEVLRVIAPFFRILARLLGGLRQRIDRMVDAGASLIGRTLGGARVAAGTARHRANRLAVSPAGLDWRVRGDAEGSTSLNGDDDQDARFTLDVHENEYLRRSESTISAVLSIGSQVRPQPLDRPEMVEVILLDCSASMGHPWEKIINARRATHAAVASLPDGVWFAVVRGAEAAEVAYPRRGGLARASDQTRREAFRAIAALQPVGGTAIGRWLRLARELVALRPGALGHALLLTDGKDEDETPAELQGALDYCEGAFQCDCRGIGTDWAVAELRQVSTALLGSVDIIMEPAGLEADFRSVIEQAVSAGVEASIRIRTPMHATVAAFRQVSPTVVDLSSKARRIDAQTIQFRLGRWADERREYHISVRVQPAAVGCEMAACRLSVVVGERVHCSGLVRTIWTDDPELAARLDPEVAHYTGQEELAAAVQQGLLARREGDFDTATLRLGQARQLAASGGNSDLLSLLDNVVEVVDRDTGKVTLRKDVELYVEMALDTRSTRTVPTRTTARITGAVESVAW
jgi:hypothetical protein